MGFIDEHEGVLFNDSQIPSSTVIFFFLGEIKLIVVFGVEVRGVFYCDRIAAGRS